MKDGRLASSSISSSVFATFLAAADARSVCCTMRDSFAALTPPSAARKSEVF